MAGGLEVGMPTGGWAGQLKYKIYNRAHPADKRQGAMSYKIYFLAYGHADDTDDRRQKQLKASAS